MIDGQRVIAVIPARAGSKSVKDKNLHPLGGKPLIAYAISTANSVPLIDRVIVSTDGDQIAEASVQLGAEVYRRPTELGGDQSLVIDTLRDIVATLRSEDEQAAYMLLLEPTSPFRSVEDVSGCIRQLHEQKLDSVATFMEPELNPNRAWRINGDVPEPYIQGADPWQPRQLLPTAWQLNGAVYAFRISSLPAKGGAMLFGKCGAVIMPQERSFDIDDKMDFMVAETIVRENLHAHAS